LPNSLNDCGEKLLSELQLFVDIAYCEETLDENSNPSLGDLVEGDPNSVGFHLRMPL
jgi:hypothetical protein